MLYVSLKQNTFHMYPISYGKQSFVVWDYVLEENRYLRLPGSARRSFQRRGPPAPGSSRTGNGLNRPRPQGPEPKALPFRTPRTLPARSGQTSPFGPTCLVNRAIGEQDRHWSCASLGIERGYRASRTCLWTNWMCSFLRFLALYLFEMRFSKGLCLNPWVHPWNVHRWLGLN